MYRNKQMCHAFDQTINMFRWLPVFKRKTDLKWVINFCPVLRQDIRRFFAPKSGHGGGSSSTDDEPKNKKNPPAKVRLRCAEMSSVLCRDVPLENVLTFPSLTCSDYKQQSGGKTISKKEEKGHRWFRCRNDSSLNPVCSFWSNRNRTWNWLTPNNNSSA